MMYISIKQISVLAFAVIAILSSFISILISIFFDYSISSTFIGTLFALTVTFLIVAFRLKDKIWLKEITNYSFCRFKDVHNKYRNEVVKNDKIYNRFVEHYYANNQMISYSVDANGNHNVNEYNQKNSVLQQINTILRERKDLVDKYFDNENFSYQDYESLIQDYEKTYAPTGQIKEDVSNKLERVKNEILKYESGGKTPKHYGHRMFGYLLKEGYINAVNDEQRLKEWQNFTGLETKPELDYLRNPDSNKNGTSKINQQLKEISNIFDLIGLKITINYHTK